MTEPEEVHQFGRLESLDSPKININTTIEKFQINEIEIQDNYISLSNSQGKSSFSSLNSK